MHSKCAQHEQAIRACHQDKHYDQFEVSRSGFNLMLFFTPASHVCKILGTQDYKDNNDNNQEATGKNIYSPDIYLVSPIKKQAYISDIFLIECIQIKRRLIFDLYAQDSYRQTQIQSQE